MSEFLSRFSLDAVKFSTSVLLCMIVIWLALVGCAISSLYTRPWNKRQRLFWMLWIICLPGLGLLSYLPFSLSAVRPTNTYSRKHKRQK